MGASQTSPALAVGSVFNTHINSAAAIALSKLAAGTMRKIAETITTVNSTTITFTGLNLATAKKYVLIYNITVGATDGQTKSIYFNNDTTATNYYTRRCIVTWGATPTIANTAVFTASGSNEDVAGEISIMQTDNGFCQAYTLSTERNGANTYPNVSLVSSAAAIANVTRLDIVSAHANEILAGSTFRLYQVD